jgi:ABC-type uncharacterized transport system substrate-binding protein
LHLKNTYSQTQTIAGKTALVTIVALCLLSGFCGCRKQQPATSEEQAHPGKAEKIEVEGPKRKILLINSYHEGYAWSKSVDLAVRKTLEVAATDENVFISSKNNLILKVFWMDTRRNASEEFKKEAGLKAKEIIESWKPDVVICVDDNAFKYIVMPFYKNAATPFVFCGVNWNIEKYEDAPYDNITGMVEVWLVPDLIKHLAMYSSGTRIGYMAADVLSERDMSIQMQKTQDIHLDNEVFVKTFDKWKREFLSMQDKVDLLVWANYVGIKNWNDDEAKKFALENTRIPTGTISPWMTQHTLIVLAQSPEEQGQWAANAALEILSGKLPNDIPIATNKKGKIFLNMVLAKKLGIIFPMELIKQSTLIDR